MKFLLLIVLYSITQAPKTYTFDYRLVYEYRHAGTEEIVINNLYGNKLSNTFTAIITTRCNAATTLYFNDINAVNFSASVSGDIINPGNLMLPRNQTNSGSAYFPDKSKDYSVNQITDTLVNGKNFARMQIISKNAKRSRRKKIGTSIYHINTAYNFIPIFDEYLMTQLYKNGAKIPNGVVSEIHSYNYDGSFHFSKILKEIATVDFSLTITD